MTDSIWLGMKELRTALAAVDEKPVEFKPGDTMRVPVMIGDTKLLVEITRKERSPWPGLRRFWNRVDMGITRGYKRGAYLRVLEAKNGRK